jgi:cytochrome P450
MSDNIPSMPTTEPTRDVLIPGGGDPADPYPGFAEARTACPVLKVEGARPSAQAPPRDVFTLFRHADVHAVLRDPQGFSSAIVGEMMGAVLGRTILEMDGAEHLRHRALVAQAFRPKVLERWRATLIEPLVHRCIDDFVRDGRADLVRQLNFRFPVLVIAHLLGLPAADHERFQSWSVDILAYAAHAERGLAASQALRAYLGPVITARRDQPADDLISELVSAEIEGERLTDDEILPFLLLLLPAGAETTYRAFGNLLYALLTDPEQLAAVRADRSLVTRAVEEGLRWEPPLLILTREATGACRFDGIEVPAGGQVAVVQGSANRDPDHWGDDAHRYDLHRPPRQHLSFGFGPHMCLGMHLARLEMAVALEAVLDRLPGLRLDPEAADVGIRGLVFRSPTALPVLFDA